MVPIHRDEVFHEDGDIQKSFCLGLRVHDLEDVVEGGVDVEVVGDELGELEGDRLGTFGEGFLLNRWFPGQTFLGDLFGFYFNWLHL